MAGINLEDPSRFSKDLAQSWNAFVGCDKRLVSEGPFLQRVLRDYKDGIVLDAALGIGCESVFLIQRGYKVISNEINAALLEIAIASSIKRGVKLNVKSYDWRTIGSKMPGNSLDAIILLGNSLCLVKKINQ